MDLGTDSQPSLAKRSGSDVCSRMIGFDDTSEAMGLCGRGDIFLRVRVSVERGGAENWSGDAGCDGWRDCSEETRGYDEFAARGRSAI
jgi:hypothetical protein